MVLLNWMVITIKRSPPTTPLDRNVDSRTSTPRPWLLPTSCESICPKHHVGFVSDASFILNTRYSARTRSIGRDLCRDRRRIGCRRDHPGERSREIIQGFDYSLARVRGKAEESLEIVTGTRSLVLRKNKPSQRTHKSQGNIHWTFIAVSFYSLSLSLVLLLPFSISIYLPSPVFHLIYSSYSPPPLSLYLCPNSLSPLVLPFHFSLSLVLFPCLSLLLCNRCS